MRPLNDFLDPVVFEAVVDGKMSYDMALDCIKTAMKRYAIEALKCVDIIPIIEINGVETVASPEEQADYSSTNVPELLKKIKDAA